MIGPGVLVSALSVGADTLTDLAVPAGSANRQIVFTCRGRCPTIGATPNEAGAAERAPPAPRASAPCAWRARLRRSNPKE